MYDNDDVVVPVSGIDESEVELAKSIMWGLIFGCGYKENLREVEKMWSYYSKAGPFPYAERLARRAKMSQKICNYRKPKLQWYGRQTSTNFIWNPMFTQRFDKEGPWKPLGKIYIASAKPLRINEKEKETD